MRKNRILEEVNNCVGRPRDARCTQKVLDAALELGTETGFSDLTMEGIAARAGVGKTTIYRRWSNIWAIVVDALLAEASHLAPVQHRPTARQSLSETMHLVAKIFRSKHGRTLRALIGRAQMDRGLRKEITEHWLHVRRQLSREIILQGIASGELRADLDPDIALDSLYGAMYYRLLLPYDGDDVKLPDAYVDALVDAVFCGLEKRKGK